MVLAFLRSTRSAAFSGKVCTAGGDFAVWGWGHGNAFSSIGLAPGSGDWKAGHSWSVDTWSLRAVWASSQCGGLGEAEGQRGS